MSGDVTMSCNVPVVASDSGGEVRKYVSNIGRTPAELAELILNHREKVVQDPLPVPAKPERNSSLYIHLFDMITGIEHSSRNARGD